MNDTYVKVFFKSFLPNFGMLIFYIHQFYHIYLFNPYLKKLIFDNFNYNTGVLNFSIPKKKCNFINKSSKYKNNQKYSSL